VLHKATEALERRKRAYCFTAALLLLYCCFYLYVLYVGTRVRQVLRKAKEALERRNEHKVKEQKAGRDHYKEQVLPSVLRTKLN
jgi:Ca2+/Na+ antiporter